MDPEGDQEGTEVGLIRAPPIAGPQRRRAVREALSGWVISFGISPASRDISKSSRSSARTVASSDLNWLPSHHRSIEKASPIPTTRTMTSRTIGPQPRVRMASTIPVKFLFSL